MITDIHSADLPRDLATIRSLFAEYAAGLGFDLCFQGFDTELATLPGKYAAPAGRLLLAWQANAAVGCVALRPLDPMVCEMKRLYLQPRARGEQLGYRLAKRICEEARVAGYQRICLDTLPTMTAALAIYQSLGFKPTAPYIYNPIPEAQFLALDL